MGFDVSLRFTNMNGSMTHKAYLTCVASGFEKATDAVVLVIVGCGKYDVTGASTSSNRMSKLLSEI